MHVRNHLCRNKKKIKKAEFLLRGWTQTKILFRKMEKIFRLKHDRDSNSPSNAGAAVIKPVILHLSGIWWLLLSAAVALGPTDWRVKTGSLSQNSPLCVQIQAYWEFCPRASATIKSTKTTVLWLEVASLNLNVLVSEKPPRLFLSSIFWTKSWDIFRQVPFLSRKNLKDSPPFPCCTGLHYWQLYKYSVWPIHVRVQCSIKLGIALLHPFKNLILIFFVLI